MAVFAGFARLVKEINNFIALNGALDGFIQQQGQVTKGIAADKKAIFNALVNNIVAAARKALVFAKDNDDNAMQAALDVRERSFVQSAGTRAVAKMEQIFGILEGNAAALADYMVSAGDIEAIGNGIAAFTGQQPAPGVARAARVAARKSMVETMGAIDGSLEVIDDLLVNTYGASAEEMVLAYRVQRLIKNNEVRHSGLVCTLTDAGTGALLEGATVAIEALGKTAVTNIEGVASIIKMKWGTYHVVFSAEGYVTQTLTLTIERGRIGKVAVGMVSL